MSEAPGTIEKLRITLPPLHEKLKGKTGKEYVDGLTELSEKIIEHIKTTYDKENDFDKTLQGWANQLERAMQNEESLEKLQNGEKIEFTSNTLGGKGATHQHNEQANSEATAAAVHGFLGQLGGEYIKANKHLGGLGDEKDSPSSIATTIKGSPAK